MSIQQLKCALSAVIEEAKRLELPVELDLHCDPAIKFVTDWTHF